jgi:hypothetical protein
MTGESRISKCSNDDAACTPYGYDERAVMNPPRTVLASLIPLLLAACGPASAPKIAEKADVTITLDGKRQACVVALAKEALGSAVPCAEVVPFVRDELRLPSGSIFDMVTVANADEAQVASVGAHLKGAGYRFIGGRRVPF